MKPCLKWVGGKTQILDTVLALFPKHIRNYYEPFIGGGSVLLGLLSKVQAGDITVTGTVYASDLNPILIGLYKTIQSNPDGLIASVKELTTDFAACTGTDVNRQAETREDAMSSQESYYYWIRSRFNALTPAEKLSSSGSAMFLFLNKTCFRGVYREGPHGFNVPFGNYKNPTILEEDHIRSMSTLLQGVVFTVSSFQDALTRVRTGDFVYLDPPYAPEAKTSFVSYTADGFGLENHNELFRLCRSLHSFLMSNADVPLVREAFPESEYTIHVVECRRAIHSKKPNAKTNEVLILTKSS